MKLNKEQREAVSSHIISKLIKYVKDYNSQIYNSDAYKNFTNSNTFRDFKAMFELIAEQDYSMDSLQRDFNKLIDNFKAQHFGKYLMACPFTLHNYIILHEGKYENMEELLDGIYLQQLVKLHESVQPFETSNN